MTHKTPANILFVMGVSGCGKTTLGQLLAQKLSLPFFDGDDFHPPSNIQKMASGQPLTDDDRASWLDALHALAVRYEGGGAVIACSALKQRYRDLLKNGLMARVWWVHPFASFDVIWARMSAREGHFMPISLLESQFEALELPDYDLRLDATLPPESLADAVIEALRSA